MKSTFITLLALLLLSANLAYSQRTCGTDHEHEERMKDPGYRELMEDINRQIEILSRNQNRIPCSAGTFEFPVAIHYNWSGIGTTVTQCMIDAAVASINALNNDFAALNSDLSDYDALTAACSTAYPAGTKSTGSCISFCIASYDHPGCSGLCDGELAITAGQFSYPNTGGCFGDYINIFVQANTGQLGIAPLGGVTFLGGNGPQVDISTWGGPGTLCTSAGQTFNGNPSYNLGRTLTHEMGHYFGLKHPFQGTCVDDDIADTPLQSTENGGKPVVVDCNPANAANTANNTCNTLDMWCSYMDYSDDSHLFMFTTNQSERMYALAQLSPIASSATKCNGTPQAPTADFTINDVPVFCSGDPSPYTIDIIDNSTRCPTSWAWTFSGAGVSPTSSALQDPSITVSSSGDLTITLVATNAAGASTMISETIYVSVAPAGSCPDCGPTFYDTGGPNNPYSNNEVSVWTYCADPGQVLTLDVNALDLPGGLFTDAVRIFEGTTVPSDLSSYVAILGQNNGSGGGFWTPTTGGTVGYSGTSFTSDSQCLTFRFASDAANTGDGWDVDITCVDEPTCMDGMQNQDEEFVDCGGPNCPSCGSLCGFTFTDMGGLNNNYSVSNQGQTWLICADDPDQKVKLDFSLFQAGGAALLIYEGSTVPSNPNNYAYNVQQGGYFIAGGGYSTSNPITSQGQCFSFYFSVFNSSTATTPGFEALVSCCDPTDIEGCPYKNTAGQPFSETISNYCSENQLGDILTFRSSEIGSNRSCTTLSANQVFYEITCDGTGGTLEVDVSANSNGGTVDAALYGPVSGTCPNYSGGTQVACDSGTDPAPLSIITQPNEKYILVVASNRRGEFTVTGSGLALPLNWVSFKGILSDGGGIHLDWQVEDEVNNKGFEVLRSNDGIHFDKIGFVHSDSDQKGAYQYIDNDVFVGDNYYKLRQIDFDGKSEESKTILIVNSPSKESEFNIYPNPTNSKVFLSSDSPISSYELVDAVGKTVSSHYQINTKIHAIDVSNLAEGIYYIKVKVDAAQVFKKIFIVR